jgi:sarcosine oxidase subunit alpha
MRFTWDGRPVPFGDGDTVAAALWREKVRILSRSLRFHRPRGYFCGTGSCNQCMVRVDGVPNVKACLTECAAHMQVESQNAWPSAERDVWRLFDAVYREKMDIHGAFLRPRFLQPFYQKIIRAFSGLGRLPAKGAWADAKATWEERDVDVLVIGGGPGGLAAAREASESGAEVALLEQDGRLGGRVVAESPAGRDGLGPLAENAKTSAEIFTGTGAMGRYPDGSVAAVRGADLIRFRPKALVLAPGTYENDALFENNDLPGIMTAGAALRLLHRHGVWPGKRIAVLGANVRGVRAATEFREAGMEVCAVVGQGASRAAGLNLPVKDATIARALGSRALTGIQLSTGERVECDALVLATGLRTRPELFQQAGCALAYDRTIGGFAPRVDERFMTTAPGVFAAGEAAGAQTVDESTRSGRIAGASASIHAGFDTPGVHKRLRRELEAAQ